MPSTDLDCSRLEPLLLDRVLHPGLHLEEWAEPQEPTPRARDEDERVRASRLSRLNQLDVQVVVDLPLVREAASRRPCRTDGREDGVRRRAMADSFGAHAAVSASTVASSLAPSALGARREMVCTVAKVSRNRSVVRMKLPTRPVLPKTAEVAIGAVLFSRRRWICRGTLKRHCTTSWTASKPSQPTSPHAMQRPSCIGICTGVTPHRAFYPASSRACFMRTVQPRMRQSS